MKTKRTIYKPSQVLRLVKAGELVDPQPRGAMRIVCDPRGHRVPGETESPMFWENGMYAYCPTCKRWALARIIGRDFEIELRGERRRYPPYREAP